MSRIGKLPITVPSGVDVQIDGRTVTFKGPKGTLSHTVIEPITVERDESGAVVVNRPDDERRNKAFHGLSRSLLNNLVVGVTEGYEKRLEIQGVGYRAALRGQDLELQLGFSHPVNVKAPDGIIFEVPQPTQIIVRGNSKHQVGEIAAQIRKWRPPEPYKGKGIRYADEYVQRKVGKRA